MSSLRAASTTFLALLLFCSMPSLFGQCEVAKLQDPHESINDSSANAVSISGSTIVLGAGGAFDPGSTFRPGAAYVFNPMPTGWEETIRLYADDGTSGDAFGVALDIEGDTLIVGAPGDDIGGADTGAAYAFARTAGTWTQVQKIIAPSPASSDEFGNFISLSGDLLLIGRPRSSAGSAVLYNHTAAGWSPLQTLVPSDGTPDDDVGHVGAIDEGVIALGDKNADLPTNHHNEGAVYVFESVGGVYQQTAKLFASDKVEGDKFGTSVAVQGHTIIVGAPFHSVAGKSGAGAAYVFDKVGSGWLETAKIANPHPVTNDLFGQSVAIHGDSLVIGVINDDTNGDAAGAAHLFARSGSSWNHVTQLIPSDKATHQIGWSVAIDGDNVVIGEDDCCIFQTLGHAFVFSFHSSAGSYGTSCPGSGGFAPTLALSGCPAPAGNVQLGLSGGLASSLAILLFGTEAASIPLGAGCLLQVNPNLAASLVILVGGAGPGGGTISLPVIIAPDHPSGTFEMQAFIIDPGSQPGFTASNGVRVTIS